MPSERRHDTHDTHAQNDLIAAATLAIKVEPGDNIRFAIPDATVDELITRAAAHSATVPASSTTAP